MTAGNVGDAAVAISEPSDQAPAPVPDAPDRHSGGAEPDAPPAGLARRLIARFALLAFGLYHVPLFLNNYPTLGGGGGSTAALSISWGHVFGQVGLWVARHVFQLNEIPDLALSGDNGDTAEEFCRLLVGVIVAAIAAAIWTFADRRRPGARWVDEALRVLLRYAIALGLASYAVAKLYPIQFDRLSPTLLETRIGELDPMSLAWTFMKYSRVYSTIAGVLELSIVLLLCFRRTATLGALVCVPVMLNVMLVNLCYGVNVKLFSMMIVLSALVLVLHDARRLAQLLVLHRTTPATTPRPPFRSRRWNQARWLVKLVLVCGVLLSSDIAMRRIRADTLAAEASPLYGTWETASFVVNGRELVGTAEPSRWRRALVSVRGAALRLEDDTLLSCRATRDDAAHRLDLTCPKGSREGSLHWQRDADQLRLEGTFDHAAVTVSLKRRDDSDFPLLRQQFRWLFDI